jgi:hypothetical protein
MRGCVFVEKFDSVDDVVKNGMTIGGGVPTFTPGAVTFDGASYLVYPIANTSVRGSCACSLDIECTAQTAAGTRFAATLGTAVGANDALAVGFAAGTWQIYLNGVAWLNTGRAVVVGEKVRIGATYSGAAGTVRSYIDGVAGPTQAAYTQAIVPSALILGGLAVGSSPFVGQVRSVRLFNQELSPEEVLQYATNNVYSYRSRASIVLQMRNVDHQALQTLDTSGNSRHGVFSAVVPTKLQRHGYDLNGASQYFTVSTVGLPLGGVAGANTGVTFAVEFEADFAGDDGVGYDLIDSTDGSAWPQPTRHIVQKDALNRLVVFIAGTNLTPVAFASFAPYWYRTGRNVIVASCKSGKSNLWLNGGRLLADDATVIGAAVQTSLYVGASPFPSAFFNGRITRVGVWGDLALTTVQIFDLLALWQKIASEA